MSVAAPFENQVSVQERTLMLDRIPMLHSLTGDAREALAAASSMVPTPQGTVVAMEGDIAPPVFFVLDGLVVGFRIGADGRSQTLTRLHCGDPFYIPCALGKDSRAPVSTRATRPSVLFHTPQHAFRNLVQEHPSLALAALTELSNKVAHFVRLAGNLGVLSVRARLARLLLELAEGCDPPTVEGTHEDLAAGVGSVREVVSRHLHELSQAGMIRVSRGRVELIDIAGLRGETGRTQEYSR